MPSVFSNLQNGFMNKDTGERLGFMDSIGLGANDPDRFGRMALLGNAVTVGDPGNFMEGVPQAFALGHDIQRRKEQDTIAQQEREQNQTNRQELVNYALSVVPDNLKSLARSQPETAIKFAQQQNPNIEPYKINDQLVDANTYEVLGDYRDPMLPKAPTVREITLDDGSEAAVQWNPQTEVWDPLNAPMGGGTANPKDKLTEVQSKYALFGRMQQETAPVLDSLEEQFNPANSQDAMARSLPIAGNFFQSEQGQIYNTAAAAWSEGALRIATGAAATQPEIERTQNTYFAQPGDTPNTIHFKSEMRKMYSRALEAARGLKNIDGQLPDPMEFAQSFALKNQQQGAGDAGSNDLNDLLEHMPQDDRALFEGMI